MGEEYQVLLEKQDWHFISRQLMAFGVALYRRDGKKAGQLIGKGKVIEDVVYEAIESVFLGQRRWDPKRGELLKFLKYNVFKSIKSNIYKGKEQSLMDCLDIYYDENQENCPIEGHVNETPESKFADAEALENLMALSIEKVKLLKNDEAMQVFECLCEGISTPRDIEVLTEISSLKVSEIKRQIRNKLKDVYHV